VADNEPYTLLGDGTWTDVTASVNVSFSALPPTSGTATLTDGGDAVPQRGEADGNVAVTLQPCDASSPYQQWANNTQAAAYVSVTPSGPASTVCLNSDGCGASVIGYTCVTTGGSCCGATCYAGLQWIADDGGQWRCAVNGNCLTANGTGAMLAPCGSAPNQTWTWSGQQVS